MRIRLEQNSERGTSLSEVVISVAILAVVAGGILGCFGHSFFVTRVTRENQRATQILLEKAETIRLYSWDQVNSNGFIPTTFTNVFDPQGQTGSKGVIYNGTMQISAFPFNISYSSNMKQLTLTVKWNTSSNLPHTRTYSTWIAKDGLQNYVY